jgi:cellulose synthase/poly-beta-1,6-N-acetylglucosamine synthase-like glycosyltransferase
MSELEILDSITVVIPVHPERVRNGMLERALSSVRSQTLPADEIIVVEDHEGQGAARTRHQGLMEVTSEWVAFLDSDDEFLPRHLERLMACAQETEADFVYSWYKIKGASDPMPNRFGKAWNPDKPALTTITVMVKTQLAQRVGFHPDPNRVKNSGEDMMFVRGCNSLGAKIVHLPERTWVWHHHGGNTSGLNTRGDAVPPAPVKGRKKGRRK